MKTDFRPGYATFQLSNAELIQLARLQASKPDEVDKQLDQFLKDDRLQAYDPQELQTALESLDLSPQLDRLQKEQDKPWSYLDCGLYRRLTLPEHEPQADRADNCASLAQAALSLFDDLDGNHNGRLSGRELESALHSDRYHGDQAATLVCLRSQQSALQGCKRDGSGITRADLESLAEKGITQGGKTTDKEASAHLNLSFEGRKQLAQTLPLRLPLSQESFDPADLRQGKSGSCVSLATLIGRTPGEVAGMFTSNPDGTITVTFRDGSRCTVEDVSDAERLYQASAGQGERWPALLELAEGGRLASLGGDREFPDRAPRSYLARGQRYNDAFGMLAGSRPRLTWLTRVSPNQARQSLQEALKAGPAVSASRWPSPSGVVGNGVVSNHAYAVLAYDPESDRVKLRNPWHNTEWAGHQDGVDDGVFEMPFLQFYASFRDIVGHGGPPGLVRQGYHLAITGLRHCLGLWQQVCDALVPWDR